MRPFNFGWVSITLLYKYLVCYSTSLLYVTWTTGFLWPPSSRMLPSYFFVLLCSWYRGEVFTRLVFVMIIWLCNKNFSIFSRNLSSQFDEYINWCTMHEEPKSMFISFAKIQGHLSNYQFLMKKQTNSKIWFQTKDDVNGKGIAPFQVPSFWPHLLVWLKLNVWVVIGLKSFILSNLP